MGSLLRAGRWRPSLVGAPLAIAPVGCCPYGRPPLAGGRQPPCKGALAATGRPLAGGLGRSRLPLAASHG
ncbi:hypothetical protein BHM03_00007317 [Ensete ventricosum]|nr:hypothetical protein BHM03_00007317 [Ensete ventricosum]